MTVMNYARHLRTVFLFDRYHMSAVSDCHYGLLKDLEHLRECRMLFSLSRTLSFARPIRRLILASSGLALSYKRSSDSMQLRILSSIVL